MADNTLLYQTLDQVIAADAQNAWRQAFWITLVDTDGEQAETGDVNCQTAGCFAGWRALMDGARPTWDFDNRSSTVIVNGVWHDIQAYAKERLDLNDEEADVLFFEENSLEDLKRIVDEIVAGEYR